ncbi:MAG: tail fiber protein [Alphaproteobacteria bacterium]
MSTPFLSEIRLMSFGFAPKGWTMCNGQLLPINQNQALFSLLGTTYGGDGRVNFGLPDLRGRVPTHMGGGLTLGERAGTEAVTISISTMPTHAHTMVGTSDVGTNAPPSGQLLGASPAKIYDPFANPTTLQPGTIGNTGGSQAHNNMQPFLVLNFCIALQGIFPSQT